MERMMDTIKDVYNRYKNIGTYIPVSPEREMKHESN